MIGTPRAAGAPFLPLTPPRRAPGRRAAPVALLALLALATPARAFLPGSLAPPLAERLAAAGYAGVPEPRALRLPADPAAPVPPWHLLTVLVDFPDRRGDRGAGGPAAWQRTLFAAGERSLAGYYAENSYGRLALEGEVTSWVRADSALSYYVSDGVGNAGGGIDPAAYPHNSQRLVEEVVRKLGPRYDWARYDNNGDGLVDGLLLVAAGEGADETAPLELATNRVRLLAHQFHTSAEVTLPGARVFDYAIVAANAPLGVVAHEVGHLFGLIDLYQSGGFAGVDGPFGLGDWSLMATGALLDGGRTPCHLDAWSKARLGFTHPDRFGAPGREARRLPAAEDSAAALRLGPGARDSEYFLAEARFRRGFDAALPGEGLLVYHVDETVQTNSSSARYRVALVQADGRDDLGSQQGNRGDAGDPYPSAPGGNDSLTATSTPSSARHDGSDSGVRLTAIRRDGAAMRFDAAVATAPRPRVVRATLREFTGDGDGIVEAGEEGAIDLLVTNVGSRAPLDDMVLRFLPPLNPEVELVSGSLELAGLGAAEARFLPEALAFRLDPGFPAAGREIRFPVRFEFSAGAGGLVSLPDTVELFVGPVPSYGDDFETGAPGWTHATLRATSPDRWHLSDRAAHSPTRAWFLGRDNGAVYDAALDDALVSPEITVPPGGRLLFWQRVEAESLSSNRAWDGGRVEISGRDGAWTPLAPVGGYPFRVESGSGNPLFGAEVFSGRRGWQQVAADLSAWAGMAVRLRFRFASDFFGAAPADAPLSGWFIDDVRVEAGPALPPLTAVREGAGVRLRWTEPTGSTANGWRLVRRLDAEGAAAITLAELPASPGAAFTREDLPPPGTYRYGLVRLGAAGPEGEVMTAPVTVALSGGTLTLAPPYPNPYRPTGPWLTFELSVPAGGAAARGALEVIDIGGRLVTRLPLDAAPGALQRLRWDGRTTRGPLRAGVYFVRLRLENSGGGFVYGTTHRLVVVN